MHSIDIKECIKDRQSLFNIKRFKYRGLKFNIIPKTIDIKNIKLSRWEFLTKKWKEEIILENTKEINSLSLIERILEKERNEQKKYFKSVPFLSDYPNNIIFTFNFKSKNDVEKLVKTKDYIDFFDLYYGYSNFWLFVPNVKPKKYICIQRDNKGKCKKSKLITILTHKDYMKYVDTLFEILNYRNSKPIFVPISLKFNIKEVKEILNHYLKKEYFYIWFDFEGSAVNENSLGILRHIYRILDEKGRFGDAFFYFTNIKREITSHVKDEKTPASDVLSTLIGGNIIGSNREPRRVVDENVYTEEELRLHKARILERKSYYYVKVVKSNLTSKEKEELLKVPKYNVMLNNVLLHEEISSQCNEFLEGGEIQSYITTKEMLNKYPKGKLLFQKIFKIKKQKVGKLSKWF